MPLSKIEFRPGIRRESTQLNTGPSWYDGDRVRFRSGKPEKIGGWEKYSNNTYKGVARSLIDWGTSDAARYVGLGTNLKLYVETGSAFFDITPIRATTAAGDVTFSASAGDATLTVTDTAHGAVIGDYVTFSGAVSLGGNITADVLNHEYRIDTVIDDDNYTVEATDTDGDTVLANGSDTGNGGASVVGEYQINVGTNTYIASLGYGVGPYGEGPYGGSGALAFAGQLRLWSQDIFGNDLIACPRNGSIYYWDESSGTGTRAVELSSLGGASDTPVKALQVMVSPIDRHVIAFGVNPIGSSGIDPLLVRWSDQENAADWTPTAINSAGGQVLSTGSEFIGAVKTRQEILIFTDTSIHSMRFVGNPFVFQFAPVAENVSILSPNAAIPAGDSVYFMGQKGFYVYEGAVRPLRCDVHDYVFENLDTTQPYKIFALTNPDESEITWFYAAGDSDSEVNRYVTYDYAQDIWTIGSMDRGAWIHAPTKTHPLASSNDLDDVEVQYLYNQEKGSDADGATMDEYIESGGLIQNGGEFFHFVDRVIPDFRWDGMSSNASMLVSLKKRNFPLEDFTTDVTKTVTEDTQQLHVRVRAREIALRIEGNGSGFGWTMGNFLMDVRTDGRR